MDALDPDKSVEIVGNLYHGDYFVDSLYNALSEGGVVSSFECPTYSSIPITFFEPLTHHLFVTSSSKFVVQIGEAETNRNPAVEWGQSQDKAEFVRKMLYAMFLVQSSCISTRYSCSCPLSTSPFSDQ